MCSDDTTVRIPLRARGGPIKGYTLVDAADADFVNQWRWNLSTKGYAVRGVRVGKRTDSIRLHRELLGLVRGDGLEGDHRNLNKLDNRRSNLRVIPKTAQQQNMPSRTGSSSQYRGVSWNKAARKWEAHARAGGKSHYLGLFVSEEEAAEAARAARALLMPYATD